MNQYLSVNRVLKRRMKKKMDGVESKLLPVFSGWEDFEEDHT